MRQPSFGEPVNVDVECPVIIRHFPAADIQDAVPGQHPGLPVSIQTAQAYPGRVAVGIGSDQEYIPIHLPVFVTPLEVV